MRYFYKEAGSMLNIEKPDHRISRDFIYVKRLEAWIWFAAAMLALVVLIYLGFYFEWPGWLRLIIWAGILIEVGYAVWAIGLAPILLQRYWRYGMNREYIQLQHGRLIWSHELIPLAKVQYVQLQQGPFLRKRGLYALEIGTMGSSHSIPGLPEAEALVMRDEIARHANIKDEDAI